MPLQTLLSRICPLLVAIWPILHLYRQNTDEVRFTTAAATMLIVVSGVVIFMAVIWLVLRNDSKAGFLAAAWLFIFFSYGPVMELVEGWTINGFIIGRQRFVLLAEIGLAALVLLITIKGASITSSSIPYISIALMVPIIFNTGGIVFYQIIGPGTSAPKNIDFESIPLPSVPRDDLPDIYYIILDSYPRADVLKRVQKFDNSQFVHYLHENDFFVADKSRTNYIQTSLSLASSLNMEYLHKLVGAGQVDSTDLSVLVDLIRDNQVVALSKRMGYRFAFLHSPWGATLANPNADVELSGDEYPLGALGRVIIQPVLGNDFGFALFGTTILGGFLDAWFVFFAAELFTNNVEKLKLIPDIEGPTLTFAHFLPPHPPYLFDREGNIRDTSNYFRSYDDQGEFIDQLIWVNKSMESAISQILKKNKAGSVIVIQGDHGTNFDDDLRALTIGGEIPDIVVQERTGILNAYHIPESCGTTRIYETITPVNTFRLIMDRCWGTDFGLLEDQTYWSTYNRPFDFAPVDEPEIHVGTP